MYMLIIQALFKVDNIFYPGLRSHFVDEVMPATDSPAIIVARYLRANGFDEVRTGTGVGLLDRRFGDSAIARSGVTIQPLNQHIDDRKIKPHDGCFLRFWPALIEVCI